MTTDANEHIDTLTTMVAMLKDDLAYYVDRLTKAEAVCRAAKWQCFDHPEETEQGLIDAIKAWEDVK